MYMFTKLYIYIKKWRVLSQNGLSAIFDIFKVRAPSYNTKQYLSNDTFLIIYKGIFLKLWSKVLQIFLLFCFIFQQIKSQISQIDQNGYNPFCNETLQVVFTFLDSFGMFFIHINLVSGIQISENYIKNTSLEQRFLLIYVKSFNE